MQIIDAKKRFIALIRVSTQKQNQSGLGLESQKHSVEYYAKSVGGEIIETIVEVESAGNRDKISIDNNLNIDRLLRKRPKLLYAIRLAQRERATILVKEASRLSRFSLLIDSMLSSGIDFVCSDSPNDNHLIIKLKTSINEEELKKISMRTKLALAAKKARGAVLGSPVNLTAQAITKAAQLRKERALQEPNYKVMGYIVMCRDKAGLIFQAICDKLNLENHRTTTGKKFVVGTVIRLYHKAKALSLN
jgi:DNA invertase Pin-like site-specific DNA recombinase